MSQYGLKAAIAYGETLKEFRDLSEAENYFISYRDDLLNRLHAVCAQKSIFSPDYTIERLKKLEKWYFDLYEKELFDQAGSTQTEFERMMSIYWGAVIVQNNEDAKWVVEEYAFAQKKYEFFVRKGSLSIAIVHRFHDLYNKRGNKRRNLLFREYNHFFAR